MAENGANGTFKSYAPILVSIFFSVAPLLFLGGRFVNRLDNLEEAVKERATGIQQHMDNLADAANARWMARDRQAEAGDQRLRALGEMLIAQSRDFVAMAGTDSRQDEAIKQAIARLDRLLERFNQLERELRPYQSQGLQGREPE